MPTLRFEGYSDDTFGEYAHFNDDYDNCASGEPIESLWVHSPLLAAISGNGSEGTVKRSGEYPAACRGEVYYLVLAPATTEGETPPGVIVTGQYCPEHSDTWMIGVANYDPDCEDRDFPRWPMRIEPQPHLNGYQPCLIIEAPDGVTIERL